MSDQRKAEERAKTTLAEPSGTLRLAASRWCLLPLRGPDWDKRGYLQRKVRLKA